MEHSLSVMALKVLTSRVPLRARLMQAILKKVPVFSYQARLLAEAVDGSHYGFCIYEAARLASLLGYNKFSVLELGCAGGNGLVNAEMHISEVKKIFPVDIELYGFDMGSGMPQPQDYRDFPHYFRPYQYTMDQAALKRRLKFAKLVIGDIKDTSKTFFENFNSAPIGCVFVDLDFYSSTRDACSLFEADSTHTLPRVFMYFDDLDGADHVWLPNEFTGELLAIEEFNETHSSRKIAKNRLVSMKDCWWRDLIYVYHDFAHPKYNQFIAHDAQERYDRILKLRDRSRNRL